MQVSEKAARDMLVAAGRESAKDLGRKVLGKTLNNLSGIQASLQRPAGPSGKLYDKVLKVLKNGGTVEVVADAAANGGKAPGKGDKAVKEGAPRRGRNGSLRSERYAQILGVLSERTAKMPKEIKEEIGLKQGVFGYLKRLVDEGKVAVTAERGYLLKA
jgi:hypothetical protein